MKIFTIISIILLFSSCSLPSFKSKPNAWQHKSTNAFSSYTKNFLSAKDSLAKSDLSRAISHAKNSADLTQLARIYLSKCALNISVGIDDNCKEYKDISSLVNSNELNAYKNLITSNIHNKNIPYLPKTYQNFALHLSSLDYQSSTIDMKNMKKITSKLLSASIIKQHLDKSSIELIIKDASYYGYKKVVIFWLHELKNKTNNQQEINIIDKKISILNSN